MGGNIVKLIFSCISTGSGWDKLRKSANDSLKNMGQLSGALKYVALQAGTVGGAIGRTLSAFAMGSIWGIAAEGATLLIDKLGLFKDKSEETKDKLDKLAEASRKFYATIDERSKSSLANIDRETKRRNEQLDITNRMIKAELQLQKARAISSGDAKGLERIDRQIAEQDQKTALQKAGYAVDSSAKRRDEAEAKMSATIAAEEQARRDLENAEEALKAASKPVTTLVQSSAGAYYHTTTPDTTRQKAEVEAAKKRLELAKQQTVAAKEAYGVERDKYELAVSNVKALKAEQEAADAEAKAKARAKVQEDLKGMKKKADDELAAWKKAEAERIKKEEEDEKTYQANKKKAEIEAVQKEVEKANEARKKALRDDIEANSKRASDLQQKLSDATARANAAHDVLGNAAGMNQGGGVSAKRREWMNNTRFANGAIDLIGSGKIRRGPNGEWVANGRLSNLNQAILDRLNADENKRKLEKENDKVVRKLDELKKAIEQMSTL